VYDVGISCNGMVCRMLGIDEEGEFAEEGERRRRVYL